MPLRPILRLSMAAITLLAGQSHIITPPCSASDAQGGEPIRIGFITSLTGAAARGGQDMVNGIALYLEQIHHKMHGRPVELIIENDESSPAAAVGKALKLLEQDRVDVLDGIYLANIAYKVAPIAEAHHEPMILAVTAADDLTKRKRSSWMIRTSFSASQPSQPFGEYVAKKLGYKRVVTLGLDYAYPWEVIGGFQRTFEEAGGRVVQKLWAPLGFMDFTQSIKSITKNADAVFFCATGGAAEILPAQYKRVGPGLPVIAAGSSFDEDVLPFLGKEAVGSISPFGYSAALATKSNEEFVRTYKAKYNGAMPSQFAESSYTSAAFIHRAVDALNGKIDDKEKFMEALRQVELANDPRGPVKLDEYGNPIENIYVRKVESVGGKLQNTVIDTFPNVSQFWKYNPQEFMKLPAYSRDYPPCKYCAP